MERGRCWGTTKDEALVQHICISRCPLLKARSRRLLRFGRAFWMPSTAWLSRLARTTTGLFRQFAITDRDVGKFVGCYSAVKSRDQAGKNADDHLDDTRALFAAQEGFSFAFESCWQILRKSQKFMDGNSCTSDASNRGNGATTEEMEERRRNLL
ncbi:hypothetical protein L916_08925 [Phytophthora nicotianae]|uniref:No apical meristem-associated C-terminal domain-containing protein n=1 Tax=Phytophthora nicotianae TaxID=4792 RepID=W2J0A0_PHYNI|nr:hypothetical protein L916_08925 [Phytophthora nicotianae]